MASIAECSQLVATFNAAVATYRRTRAATDHAMCTKLRSELEPQIRQRQRRGGDWQQQKLERDFADVCRALEEAGAPRPGATSDPSGPSAAQKGTFAPAARTESRNGTATSRGSDSKSTAGIGQFFDDDDDTTSGGGSNPKLGSFSGGAFTAPKYVVSDYFAQPAPAPGQQLILEEEAETRFSRSELSALASEALALQQLNQQLAECAIQQGEQIDCVEQNFEATKTQQEDGMKQLVKAADGTFSMLKTKCTLGGTGVGVLVGGGVGAVVAAPAMLCVGLGVGIGTATGYTIGKKLKKRWKDRITAYDDLQNRGTQQPSMLPEGLQNFPEGVQKATEGIQKLPGEMQKAALLSTAGLS